MATQIDELLKELGNVKVFIEDKMKAGISPLREEMDRISKSVTEAQKGVEEFRRYSASKVDDRGRLCVTSGKFAGFSALDLAIVQAIFEGRRKYKQELVKPETWEALQTARVMLAQSITMNTIEDWTERSLKQAVAWQGLSIEHAGMRTARESIISWRNDMFRQISKALDSTTAGSGKELVPTLEAAELWLDVNLATNVLPLLPQSPMPSNPFTIPAQFGDTNWYPTTENVQSATTTVTTNKTTLTAYGLKTGVPFSDELEEDSIVALVAELRAGLARNAAQSIDDVLLNADTTTGTTNINFDGGNITTVLAGKAQYLLGFKGLVSLPMVDNTAQNNRAAAAFANTHYNKVLTLMGKYAIGNQRSDSVFITPVNVALKTLVLAQVETMEKYGPRATISAGEISSIYGRPIIVSAQLLLADTTGKVRSATSNNTAGRILGVNTTQWRVGFRRQITFEPDREPGKSQTTLYVSYRIALAERSGTVSSAAHTSMVYDITL